VPSFTEVGARAFLAAAEGPALRELARDTLAPLASVEDGAALARTLAAYLDCGGSTGRAAELLGVHRNTVSGRVDRIRRLGLDLEDPSTRLGIHMAAHLLGH
jgi:DNA-binding PucR family transcriptional regulator